LDIEEKCTDSFAFQVQEGSRMKFYRFAQAFLVLWLIYKFVGVVPEMRSGGIVGVAGGIGAFIGSNLADLRTWLLVVGLLLLRAKLRRAAKPSE
jgi:hypothetical protein